MKRKRYHSQKEEEEEGEPSSNQMTRNSKNENKSNSKKYRKSDSKSNSTTIKQDMVKEQKQQQQQIQETAVYKPLNKRQRPEWFQKLFENENENQNENFEHKNNLLNETATNLHTRNDAAFNPSHQFSDRKLSKNSTQIVSGFLNYASADAAISELEKTHDITLPRDPEQVKRFSSEFKEEYMVSGTLAFNKTMGKASASLADPSRPDVRYIRQHGGDYDPRRVRTHCLMPHNVNDLYSMSRKRQFHDIRYKLDKIDRQAKKEAFPTRDEGVVNEKYDTNESSSLNGEPSSWKCQKEKKNKKKKKKKKGMTASERKQLNPYQIPKEGQKYEMYIPLHELWMNYVRDVIPSQISIKTPQLDSLLKLDLHGAIIKVIKSKCPPLLDLQGIVLKESENAFTIITKDNKIKTIPKRKTVFAFRLPHHDSKAITIYGDHFCFRSFERATRKFKTKPTVDL